MVRTFAALPVGCEFPAPITCGLQFPLISVTSDWMAYSDPDLHRQICGTQRHRYTETHTTLKILKGEIGEYVCAYVCVLPYMQKVNIG